MDQTLEKQKKLIYALICDDLYVPMKLKELAVLLNVSRERRSELKQALDALEAEGKVHRTGKGKYVKGESRTLTGIYQATQRGFGFVTVPGEKEDIFIPEEETGGAFHGDTVEVTLSGTAKGRRREGKIRRVVSRGMTRVVGLFRKKGKKSYGFVLPDDPKLRQDIFIPEAACGGARDGQKVVAELTSYGGAREKPEGRVTEILGEAGDPGVDIRSIIKSFDLPEAFPERAARQAERVPEAVSEADRAGRRDLRDWQTVTIDGEDARDLDDAVSLMRTEDGKGYVLGVHIADVSNYVQERSALDREALNRGTSVYLADRVIPMLPERLSNGICSLNAGEDRLALSCIMTISETGAVTEHEICESVIRVDRRMSYTGVRRILTDWDEEERARCGELTPMLEQMEELAALLRKRRHRRGAIDFDFPESKVILDEAGRPVEIRAYERNTATKMIEDFMLLANETVAEEYYWRESPFVYRVHETPDEDRIRKLAVFINNFGYSMHTEAGQVKPGQIQRLLDQTEGTPEEPLIARLALRAMKQARYSPDNDGHFGLAAPYYTHFTSPIRRYPDLQIHRIIKDTLRGRMNEKKAEHYRSILPEVAQAASEKERRADEAERETVKLKKAEYMSGHLGEVFPGVVSGITAWGIYVELPNTVEGLVHVTNLHGDHYEYREDRYEMAGVRTGRTFRLGQKLYVRVIGADCLTRTVDFELAEEGEWEDGEEREE